MKRILLSAIAALALCTVGYAQDFGFKKGSKFVEGNLSYGSGREDDAKYTMFKINTNLGYFLSEKFAIGPTAYIVDYHRLIDENPKVHVVTAGVFGRYYFLNLGKRFKTYAEIASSYENVQISTLINGFETEEPTNHGLNIFGSLGANYFITPKIALSLTLGDILYLYTSKSDLGASTFFSVDVNSLYNHFSSSNFGLTYKF